MGAEQNGGRRGLKHSDIEEGGLGWRAFGRRLQSCGIGINSVR